MHGVAFVHPVGEAEAKGGDRREVKESPDTTALGRRERVGRSEHVRAPHLLRTLHPERDHRGGVNHQLATGHVVLPGARLADVAGDDSPGWVRSEVTAHHLMALSGVAVPERPSDESGSPGYEHPHGD